MSVTDELKRRNAKLARLRQKMQEADDEEEIERFRNKYNSLTG